jgi:hypothetical protein
MPRRRADKVIEHRISLSDGLHKELKQSLASTKITNQVAMAGNAGKAVMNVAAVGAIGAIAYLGVKAYAEAKGVFPQVKQSFQKAWDWGFGVETNADGSIVPTTVTITNIHGNKETVVNPINAIPILNKTPFVGGLFDWGMKLGAATNPFEGDPVAPPPPPEPDDSIWQAHLDEQFFEEHGYSRQYFEWYQAKLAEDPDFVHTYSFDNLPDYSGMFDMPESDAAFASSWKASMEAEMRESMGDEWVDERLAEDPNFFAWKTFDISQGIGMPEMDFSRLEGMADFRDADWSVWLLDGHSPVAETTPSGVKRSMNMREWRELVAQVRAARADGSIVPSIGVDLNWNWNEYYAYWQTLWGNRD